MARLTAAVFFVLAAFAVGVPWLDRAGVALVGLAFLALTVGRSRGRERPAPTDVDAAEDADLREVLAGITGDVEAQLAPFMAAGRQAPKPERAEP